MASPAGLLFASATRPAWAIGSGLAPVSAPAGSLAPRPFQINVAPTVLSDLRARLGHTRWPDEIEGANWNYGTNRAYLQGLVAYWQGGYDWRVQERKLNRFPQFVARVDGIDVHFLHVRGKGRNPMPLLLTHGWPDSFFRFVKLIPLLTDPASHGGSADDAFTVVVPDIPGFGFSAKPSTPGFDTTQAAELFAKLMTGVLGYDKFAAHGGDFGASITEQLALHHPESLSAIHLTNVPPQHAKAADQLENLSADEKSYLQRAKAWDEKEGAFTHVQSTKPQTLSFGLNDSPVGLAAWIIEKFHGWSDSSDAGFERVFTRDDLITNVMIYWVTQTAGSAARFYFEKAHRPAAPEPTFVKVPTGFAAFQNDIAPAPRDFAARFFNIVRWTEMAHGGHFAALEVPGPLADQITDFFRPYRRA